MNSFDIKVQDKKDSSKTLLWVVVYMLQKYCRFTEIIKLVLVQLTHWHRESNQVGVCLV